MIGSQSVSSRSDATERIIWLDTIDNFYLRQRDLCLLNTETILCQQDAVAQNRLVDDASVSGPKSWPNSEIAI